MSTLEMRLEAAIKQALNSQKYYLDAVEHGDPEMKLVNEVQLIDWKERLATLIWIQTGIMSSPYPELIIEDDSVAGQPIQ